MVGFVFIAIAVFTLMFRSLITPSKNDPKQYKGTGVVLRRIEHDCRVTFYVRFTDYLGQEHRGKSITYRSTKGKYKAGETANILYCFSPKGKAFVEIVDPDLESCKDASKPVAKVMLYAAIALIVVGVFCIVFGVS
jgi:hypothetical protein